MGDGLALAAHVEGVEQLAEGQRGEGHGVGGGVGQGGVAEYVLPQPVGPQGEQAHHQPLPGQPDGEVSGEQGLPGGAGLLLHDGGLHRLHAQGQGGQGVGDQVEPQKLHRHQGGLVEVEEGGQKQRHNLADIAGEQVVDGLFDVGIDAPALLYRLDDGGEVVVGEDHVRRALGHVGAGDPHGAADVGHLQGRGVVHSVPRHGHHHALLLPRLHDPHLVLGGHPGIDGEPVHVLLQQLLGHEVQVLPGDGEVAAAEDVQLLGDGHGGELVVPGDHHRAYPRGVALFHRGLDLQPGRVDHAHQPHEGEAGLQFLAGGLSRG